MISLIAALASNRAIGKAQQLLWHLPEDMRHFRETTRGKPVIMGRKTWESLPDSFRPLPGRHNIVVSRNPAYQAPGATLVSTLETAIQEAGESNEVFVIGGAELYRQALPLSRRLYLTEIEECADGDVFFPEICRQDWEEISRQPSQGTSGPAFSFVVYQRRKQSVA
ncbi:dihydrofolate reductase [Propionivibrio sp.]|uniref:dihydrofolate reductase n=1 Tax=Propionivibrio sp. TaxID=2212460 RepID=UPI00260910D2|nr:dihydrofolate reductase [Propionivibrio sp.]